MLDISGSLVTGLKMRCTGGPASGWCRERAVETPMVYCYFVGDVGSFKPDFAAMQQQLKTCVHQDDAGAFKNVGDAFATGIAAARLLSPGRYLASEYCQFREHTNEFTDQGKGIYRPGYQFEMFEARAGTKGGRAPWVR